MKAGSLWHRPALDQAMQFQSWSLHSSSSPAVTREPRRLLGAQPGSPAHASVPRAKGSARESIMAVAGAGGWCCA
eukprot:CAMPEP_0195053372 /NCGR_PEP_ID=MMETSP0448-20130528/2527_1 /TAXON_ID=66468 /ORGANISM="Heterocapsa triquestra, Strain CCMP 448" /LENGTH=74 /DNA_ID=CAMNT_0040082655 /DNA_START=33 /DNA_END=257 /DNA_ORIENTATION=-